MEYSSEDKNGRKYGVASVLYLHLVNGQWFPEAETKRKKFYAPDGECTLEVGKTYAEREPQVATTPLMESLPA